MSVLTLESFRKNLANEGVIWDYKMDKPDPVELARNCYESFIIETRVALLEQKAVEMPLIGILKIKKTLVCFKPNSTLAKRLIVGPFPRIDLHKFLEVFFKNELKKDKKLAKARSDKNFTDKLLLEICRIIHKYLVSGRDAEMPSVGIFHPLPSGAIEFREDKYLRECVDALNKKPKGKLKVKMFVGLPDGYKIVDLPRNKK